MEAHRRTTVDDRGLAIGGIRVPFYAGALRYWRVPRAQWAHELRVLHGAGFTLVETYVPWRVHEMESGAFDWTDNRDLHAFLDAAQASGLSVVLRMGPRTDTELAGFGIPDHVLADDAARAITARGTPAWMPAPPRAFPIPSYAATAFHAHVRRWFTEIGRVVAGHDAVVAIALEAGTHDAPLFFRGGAFDLDYHPDAIAWWRESTGLDGDPPRAWDTADRARCIAWVRFAERYHARAHAAFAQILDEVGFAGIARVTGLAGAYSSREQLRNLRRRASALTAPRFAFDVRSFSPWLPPFDVPERDQLLTLLAAGARGVHLALDGIPPWLHPLFSALAEVEWPALARATPIALVDVRADHRFGLATAVANPLPPVLASLLDVGPGGAAELGTEPDAVLARRWFAAIAAALDLAQVPYAIVDEATPEDELARYRAVIAPTLTRIDRGLWQRLRALAEHKRAIVVIGPTTPTHDELGQPLPHDPPPKRVGKIREGSLDDLPGLAGDLAGLAGDLSDAWTIERPEDVRAFAHADPTGAVRVVFVINDSAKPVQAVLLVDEATQTLSDPLSKDAAFVANGRATIALPAYGVRMLVVR